MGLASPKPWIGLAALAWAVVYQQVENLTIEPRISARAVHLHPGVAFASVMLGAALFGAGGALLAIPVTAMMLAVFESYAERRHVVTELVPGELAPPWAQATTRPGGGGLGGLGPSAARRAGGLLAQALRQPEARQRHGQQRPAQLAAVGVERKGGAEHGQSQTAAHALQPSWAQAWPRHVGREDARAHDAGCEKQQGPRRSRVVQGDPAAPVKNADTKGKATNAASQRRRGRRVSTGGCRSVCQAQLSSSTTTGHETMIPAGV